MKNETKNDFIICKNCRRKLEKEGEIGYFQFEEADYKVRAISETELEFVDKDYSGEYGVAGFFCGHCGIPLEEEYTEEDIAYILNKNNK